MPGVQDLRPYQREDLRFFAQLNTGALLSEQRTGKTPTALLILQEKQVQKILIVCPASAQYQWAEEFTRWTGKPCLIAIGSLTKRTKIYQSWTHGLVISYDMLRQTDHNELVDLNEILNQEPDAVLLDEAHRIRNPQTKTAKAAFKLMGVPVRFCLTGTPTPNHAHEIWSLLHFLEPHIFKSYWRFIEDYFHTSKQTNPSTGKQYIDIGMPNKIGMEVIHSKLAQVAVQHKRKDVMTWLPDKDYIHVHLPLHDKQRKYLDELADMWETEHIITKGTLDRLIRYRQICLDPGLLDLHGEAPKTTWLLQYLKDYPDRPTIIFSKFTQYIKRLAEKLPGEKGVIIGETPIKTRQEYCRLFQAGQLKLLLINIDAGKEALTLDTAEATIFTDRYPPVGDLAQAEDRFVATTEAKADKPHLIYILSMKGSYETEINRMIQDRLTETDVINNFAKYLRRT